MNVSRSSAAARDWRGRPNGSTDDNNSERGGTLELYETRQASGCTHVDTRSESGRAYNVAFGGEGGSSSS